MRLSNTHSVHVYPCGITRKPRNLIRKTRLALSAILRQLHSYLLTRLHWQCTRHPKQLRNGKHSSPIRMSPSLNPTHYFWDPMLERELQYWVGRGYYKDFTECSYSQKKLYPPGVKNCKLLSTTFAPPKIWEPHSHMRSVWLPIPPDILGTKCGVVALCNFFKESGTITYW